MAELILSGLERSSLFSWSCEEGSHAAFCGPAEAQLVPQEHGAEAECLVFACLVV